MEIQSRVGVRGHTIYLWDVDTSKQIARLYGHRGIVTSVVFSPDGNSIASGSVDNTIRLWDVDTGTHLRTFLGHRFDVYSVVFSPDGNSIASGSVDRTIRLWDVNTGAHLRTLSGHRGTVRSVAFSPDGNTIASGSRDGTILLWEPTPRTVQPQVTGDVNQDGVVNIQDLVFVAGRFGQSSHNSADVNGDGMVNIQDLVLVAGTLETPAAAPSGYSTTIGFDRMNHSSLTAADVRGWLIQAQGLHLTDATSQRGIIFLEHLLAALTPKETTLLPNYPNPFNPETWIPYHLAHDADVTLTVYDTKGALVRRLDLGYQPAGYYTDRTRAAYWNGHNESGELVASGVYFYQLRAEDYSAVRRMVIVK